MADSSTDRSRRRRAHARGDHVLCDPARCKVLPVTLAENDPPAEAGPVEAALALFADSLTVPKSDPRAVIVACAMELARALDASQGKDVAWIAREMRNYVSWMGDFGQTADALDTIRAQRALRRVDGVLASVTNTEASKNFEGFNDGDEGA